MTEKSIQKKTFQDLLTQPKNDLYDEVVHLKKTLMGFRLDKPEKTHKIKEIRRQIARLKTALNNKVSEE